jgi:hypothetical protein
MRVIDGIHRVRAAIRQGDKAIAAKIYQGTDDDAFLLAVRLNIAHGMPLTRAERTAAAARIIQSHPQWSDRMIAATAGLSHRTVAKARARSTGQSTHSTTRLGKDGRLRPINPAAGRLRVTALLAEDPTLPISAIAQQAAVSPSTVHAVRQRLRAGQHPTPDPHQVTNHRLDRSATTADPSHDAAHGVASAGGVDIKAVLADLKNDPSPQTTNRAQPLLRCLDRYHIEISWANKIIRMVPPDWARSVAQLAHEYARAWAHIATQLDQHTTPNTCTTIPQ